jgi:hypothetical protein
VSEVAAPSAAVGAATAAVFLPNPQAAVAAANAAAARAAGVAEAHLSGRVGGVLGKWEVREDSGGGGMPVWVGLLLQSLLLAVLWLFCVPNPDASLRGGEACG